MIATGIFGDRRLELLEGEIVEMSPESPLHYYRTTCPKGYRSAYSCGHCTRAKPGQGYISEVEGRSKDLQLTEYVLVGPFLATFIASLSVRYRMSRTKIQEFLKDWTNTQGCSLLS